MGNGMKKLNDTIDVCPIHRDQPFPEKATPIAWREENSSLE